MSTPETLLETFKRLPIEMQATSHTWVTDVQKADALELIELMSTYAQALEDATTPRQPKPEWFGTGEGQWDAWWIMTWGVLRNVRLEDDGSLEGDNEAGELVSMYFDPTCNVVPVAREGFPSSVGWKVVGE